MGWDLVPAYWGGKVSHEWYRGQNDRKNMAKLFKKEILLIDNCQSMNIRPNPSIPGTLIITNKKLHLGWELVPAYWGGKVSHEWYRGQNDCKNMAKLIKKEILLIDNCQSKKKYQILRFLEH